ncbi:hypothetical protein [Bartonella quintana]|uniref:hypothetical protein n=1 Tax=Bartonella quintana TaxID=803 RepID=UPI003B96A625
MLEKCLLKGSLSYYHLSLHGWFASLIVSSEKHQAAEHYPYALRQVVPREKNLSLMGLAEAQLA